MNNKPLVSVFIPYYNDNQYLQQAIDSVLNNDYQNFELILLNHATTDNCREIAHSYTDKRIIHIDMDKNYGAGSGLLFEKILKASSGKYIKPLCADDVLRKDGLCKLVAYMENNKDVDFAFGDVQYIDKDSKYLKDHWFTNREYFSLENDEIKCLQLYAKCISFLPYIGSIIKREVCLNININKTFIMLFDVTLWVSLLANGCKIGYLNELVCNYRIHDNQVSAVSNLKNVNLNSWFEHKFYYEYFLKIKDIELAKKVWPDSPFIDKLQFKEDIPFFVAHSMFISHSPSHSAIVYLYKLLENENSRNRLEKVFNYTIKEFREDIKSQAKYISHSNVGRLKKNIYSKNVKDLGLIDLSFLFLRRLFNIITLKNIKNKTKKKEYTL